MIDIVKMALKGFHRDQCFLRASALTFYSLLAVVPILAMLFGIAKGFAQDKRIETYFLEQFQTYQEVITEAITFAKNLLEQTKGGVIAGLGVLVLVWTVVKVLSHIEDAFNHIWCIERGRSWQRKFSDYLSVSWVIPFLMIISSSIIVSAVSRLSELPYLNLWTGWLLRILDWVPYFATTVLLTFLYVFFPNTKVSFRAALIAGIATAAIYHITHGLYLYFQVRFAQYGPIYGSFAAFPLFLIWLQISWFVVLFGAELTYAIQHKEMARWKADRKLSITDQKCLALATLHQLVIHFDQHHNPLSRLALAKRLKIPETTLQQVLKKLIQARLVSKVTPNGAISYQPGYPLDQLTLQKAIEMIEDEGIQHQLKNQLFIYYYELFGKENNNILMKEIAIKKNG